VTRRWYAICTCAPLSLHQLTLFHVDVHLLRLPRPRLGDPEPRRGLRADAEPDVIGNGGDLVFVAARAGVRVVHAGDLPDRGAADG
jgi:hypothetical protein